MKIAFFVNCNNTIKIMIYIVYQELLAKEKVEEARNPIVSACVCVCTRTFVTSPV